MLDRCGTDPARTKPPRSLPSLTRSHLGHLLVNDGTQPAGLEASASVGPVVWPSDGMVGPRGSDESASSSSVSGSVAAARQVDRLAELATQAHPTVGRETLDK
jgi:hypothetical protein